MRLSWVPAIISRSLLSAGAAFPPILILKAHAQSGGASKDAPQRFSLHPSHVGVSPLPIVIPSGPTLEPRSGFRSYSWSIHLQVLLPLATIPRSGKKRSRSILMPANGWFSAHRRTRFMHSSPTGRSMTAFISKEPSISVVPGLPGGCRPRRCGRLLSSQRWKRAYQSPMMRTGPQVPFQTLRYKSSDAAISTVMQSHAQVQ